MPPADLTAGARGSAAPFRRAVFAGFVATGIFTVILGPILPALSTQWSLKDSQSGLFFTAEFLGALFGVAAFGLFAQRMGYRVSLTVGYTLMAIGMALLGAGTLPLAYFGIFVAGFGNGLVTPTSNLVVAGGEPASRAALLNLLNFAWGLGAVSCPFLVAFAERLHGLQIFLWSFAALLAAFAATFALLEIGGVRSTAAAAADQARAPVSHRLAIVLSILVTLFFLYVGAENTFGGWAASFAHEMDAAARRGSSALMPSFFWATLLLGRALAPAVLRVISERSLAYAGLSLALLSSFCLLVVRNTAALAVVVALAGLGCSTIFPIFVAWLTHFVDESAAGLRSLPFAAANFGGASLPWLVGVFSTRFGGLRAGFPLVSLAIAAMILLTILLHRKIADAPAQA